MRIATIELHKEGLGFSAGHFTIFSATEREHLHGHNYCVNVSFRIMIKENGMAFDYRYYKTKIQALCTMLDRHFLLPAQSPYLILEDRGENWIAHFHTEQIPFLKKDVVILPIVNITIEELSYWFLNELLRVPKELDANAIQGIRVRVFNGPEQSGSSEWIKSD